MYARHGDTCLQSQDWEEEIGTELREALMGAGDKGDYTAFVDFEWEYSKAIGPCHHMILGSSHYQMTYCGVKFDSLIEIPEVFKECFLFINHETNTTTNLNPCLSNQTGSLSSDS